MTTKNTELEDTASSSSSGQALRRRAEEIFLEKTAASPENLEALSPKEIRWTLHELRVHQIELEMQNEELRRAQAELDAARARYFDLYDLAPVSYCTVSEQGLILEANLTAATLLGVARWALIKQPISRFILPEDQDIYYRHRKQLFETSEPQGCELRMVNKDGTTFWAWLEVTVAQDADGAFVCRVMLSDITERRKAEDALRESEGQLRASMEDAPDGVYLNDLAGNFLYGNRKTEEIIGYRREEIIGKNMMELNLLPPDGLAKAAELLQDNIRGKSTGPDELTLNKKDGNHIIVEINTSLVRRHGQPVVIGFVRDITERKRAEEAVRRKAKELQEKNDELNRFTYAVSHDLRSPLVTIRTFQGQLEQDLRSQDAARIEMDLGYIRNAADKMSRLLDELLRLSRVGRIMNPSEEAPLQAVVKEALDLVAGRITARGVQVDLTEEPVVVTGDRTRLVEVFMNLVDNAAKFMGDQPAPRVEIGVEQVGEELALFVRDNGIGIDPRLQPMLFGLFHKLDPGSEGTGIGLALVRRIVEVHGGRIWVESEGPGKGTTFRFTLAKTRRGVGRIS